MLMLALMLSLPTSIDDNLPAHDANSVYQAVLADDVAKVADPTFGDGQSADQQRAALRGIVASDRAVDEFLRDSVTAPHLLKLRDADEADGFARSGDLYFAVRVPLAKVDPTRLDPSADAEPVEVGNMRIEAKLLKVSELPSGIAPPVKGEWYLHTRSRLLDRIVADATSHAATSRTAESLIVASRTDPRFDAVDAAPNRWAPIDRKGTVGEAHPYAGGLGYAKLTTWQADPSLVIVEVHFAYHEPKPWFDGAPILRSKLGLIAQDQVRRLRREMAKSN